MSFIVKISLILSFLLLIICIDYNSFEHKKNFEELKNMSSKFYVNPSFMFKSKEYKEFVYAK